MTNNYYSDACNAATQRKQHHNIYVNLKPNTHCLIDARWRVSYVNEQRGTVKLRQLQSPDDCSDEWSLQTRRVGGQVNADSDRCIDPCTVHVNSMCTDCNDWMTWTTPLPVLVRQWLKRCLCAVNRTFKFLQKSYECMNERVHHYLA